jgi:hypothetical protein
VVSDGKRTRIEVEWRDSQISRDGWMSEKTVLKARRNDRCRSVGYVLADDKHGIVLAGSLSDRSAACVISIPAGAIVRRRKLRSGSETREP